MVPALARLFKETPLLRSKDIEKAGFTRIELSRLVAAGEIRRVRRGLYCRPDYHLNEHGDLAIVATRIPEALICLLSALRYHKLTTQAPAEIWIAIDRKARAPRFEYPSLKVVRFGQQALTYGVETKMVDSVMIRITTIEKTIADCFKYRNKIGLDVALEALRDAVQKRLLDRDELWRCAKIDRVANVIRPYLEVLV
ncbi:MAG TPA: type IV toxin-antitoxin system AbiEi family antitoxin domain-containing protein [Spirochaetales bacterium]|nr:type IV toxin-antitoxin system AbiEi family antitoxin domain-containing protein [Spirochaetales bacterium]